MVRARIAMFIALSVFFFFQAYEAFAVAPDLMTPANSDTWTSDFLVTYRYNTSDADHQNCTLYVDSILEDVDKTVVAGVTQTMHSVTANGSHSYYIDCMNSSGGNESSATWNFDVAYIGPNNLTLFNLGQAGFEQTNPEITSLRTVITDATFNSSAQLCSLKNLGEGWSTPIPCEHQNYWLLTDNNGLKTVFVKVNHTGDVITYAYDTITLDKRGFGLDTTPPDAAYVHDDGDFTNDNTSLHFRWEGGYDRESELLRIPLQYYFRIPTTNYSSWYDVTGLTEITVPISLVEYDNYTVEMMVINSANLTNTSNSNGIVVDLTGPVIPGGGITTDYAGGWTSNSSFSWDWDGAFSDGSEGSGVAAYSFTLSLSASTEPDHIPEGEVANLSGKTSHDFSGLSSGTYYFHLAARDAAGNWGTGSSVYHSSPIYIDTTIPSIPQMLAAELNSSNRNITYEWTVADDVHSGVADYFLEMATDTAYTIDVMNYTTGNVTSYDAVVPFDGIWYARVRAIDSAGNIGHFSDLFGRDIDVTPPQFLFRRPNGWVVESPTLVIVTNENAICRYDGFKFTFTNSTYHEVRPGYAEGNYPVIIQCTDDAGLVNSTALSFNYSSGLTIQSAVIDPPDYVFTGLPASFNVTVFSGGSPIGEIPKSDFTFAIGTDAVTYSLEDMADGVYQVSFDAPGQEGFYLLNLTVDGVSPAPEYLNVSPLLLRMEFQSAGLVPQNLDYISYSDYLGITLGFATDSSLRYLNSIAGRLSVDIGMEYGSGYIIFTRVDPQFKSKEEYLQDAEFSELINPNFGYPISKIHRLRARLRYADIYLSGDKRLPPGKYNLVLRNDGLDTEDRTVIGVSVI